MAIELLTRCPHCKCGVPHSAEAIGQLVTCTGCGMVFEIPEIVRERKPMEQMAKLVRVGSDSALLANVLQVLGCLVCLTIIGIPLGLLLISYGGRKARTLACSECSTTVSSPKARICPGCGLKFTQG